MTTILHCISTVKMPDCGCGDESLRLMMMIIIVYDDDHGGGDMMICLMMIIIIVYGDDDDDEPVVNHLVLYHNCQWKDSRCPMMHELLVQHSRGEKKKGRTSS